MKPFQEETFASIRSLEELFAIASAMEREAIQGYSELADRMRREDRPELVGVFDRLVAEESRHLGNVADLSRHMTGKEPDPSSIRWNLDPTFDDEGAAMVAPELLSAYRAFSIAVRNEERAFRFWTYVAANSISDELRRAAEQMAREELNHVATLRRERRLAFHEQRATASVAGANIWPLAALENRLATLLDAARDAVSDAEAKTFEQLALDARARADALVQAPLGDSKLLRHMRPEMVSRPGPVSELLLECYLDLAESLPSEAGRERAQSCAAQLLDCISITHVAVGRGAADGSG